MLRRPMYRKMLIATALVGLLLAAATGAFADHAWGVYHWRSDNLSPTVVDTTSSPLYDVGAGVAEWAALGTAIQPTLVNGRKGNIKVTEGSSVQWLGLARIFIDGEGHITKGEVKLNTTYLEIYEATYPGISDHVLCQELGHVLGLGHNRDGLTGGSPDDSCMNDQGHLGEYTAPNSHDTDQLNLIYNHADAVSDSDDGGGGGGGPPCGKFPDHHHCQAQNGYWLTVDVFPMP